MPIPPLDEEKIWCGSCDAYGETFCIELAPSKKYPGRYYVAMHCFADADLDTTKKPLDAYGVEMFVPFFLKRHGLVLDDITWREIDAPILLKCHSGLV